MLSEYSPKISDWQPVESNYRIKLREYLVFSELGPKKLFEYRQLGGLDNLIIERVIAQY